MTMPRFCKALALCLAAFSLIGCSHVPPMTEEQLAKGCLIYGSLDMSDAPTKLQWFSLKRVEIGKAPTYWGMAVAKNRYFVHDGIELGSYQLDSFGGHSGWKDTDYTFHFPGQGGGFKIEKPTTYFLGSWKYVKAGSFFNAKFDIQPLDKPTEAEVLREIVKITSNSPVAHTKLQKRLAELEAAEKK
jgi:hypothetical protein